MTQQASEFNVVATAGGAKNLLLDPENPKDAVARNHALYCIRSCLQKSKRHTVLSCIDFRFWKRFLGSDELLETFQRSPLALSTHHDCGAYGGFARFDFDEEQERSFHIGQLGKALKVVCAGDITGDATTCTASSSLLFADKRFQGSDAHTCDALVVSCCEYDFWQRAFKNVQAKFGFSTFDILTTYGGPRMFVSPAQTGFDEHLFRNIAISQRLHGIERGVALVGHGGGTCGMEQPDLEMAYRVVQKRFPLLTVSTLWLE